MRFIQFILLILHHKKLNMSNSCENSTKPKNFNELIHSWSFWKSVIGVVVGGVLGFLYYYNVGCSSGSCGITSSPYSSIAIGGLFGYFLTNGGCKTC